MPKTRPKMKPCIDPKRIWNTYDQTMGLGTLELKAGYAICRYDINRLEDLITGLKALHKAISLDETELHIAFADDGPACIGFMNESEGTITGFMLAPRVKE